MRRLGLQDIIRPIPDKLFLAGIYGKEHRHIPGPDDRFANLFGWDELNATLQLHRLDWPRLRLARDAVGAPVETYTEEVRRRNGPPYRRVVPELLYPKLADGHTLVLDRIDQLNAAVNELAFQLESELRAPSWANLYASWAPTRGFAVHWDDHDVFVLQIDGRKTWKIFGPTRKWPLYKDIDRGQAPQGDPLVELTIEPGDVLYIPHGWWHVAQSLDEPSLHITLGVNPDNGIDLMSWLVDQFRAAEVFRARLPRHASLAVQEQHLAELKRQLLARLDDPAFLRDFFAYSDVHSPIRSRFSLPYAPILEALPEALNPHSYITLSAARASVTELGDHVEFLGAGKRMVFKKGVAPLLKLLASAHETTLHELCAAAEPALNAVEVRDLVVRLINMGVLAMSGGSTARNPGSPGR